MNFKSKEQIIEMVRTCTPPTVSLYLPMEKAGKDVRGNPIRLKNGLSTARKQLEAKGLSKREVDAFLAEAAALVDDSEFWEHQDSGLAIFIDREDTRIHKLPLEFDPLTVVGARFHIKPLLEYYTEDGRFYLLALSQNQVRFFEGTRRSIHQIHVDDMPASLAEALKYDDPEARINLHVNPRGESDGETPLFHGYGDVEEDEKTNILRFFQQIDQCLQPLLSDDDAPLILAGVDYLFPLYVEASTYPHLMSEGLGGNPENLSAGALHSRAWELLKSRFETQRETAYKAYQQAQAADQTAVGVESVTSAAYQGRVDTLFFARDVHRWGTVNPQTGEAELEDEATPENEDVLDFAVLETLKNGGTVYPVDTPEEEMPADAAVAAVLRF